MINFLSILLICSIGFTQELTVDGNLNVTGTIANQTIDSLMQVIADLQTQINLSTMMSESNFQFVALGHSYDGLLINPGLLKRYIMIIVQTPEERVNLFFNGNQDYHFHTLYGLDESTLSNSVLYVIIDRENINFEFENFFEQENEFYISSWGCNQCSENIYGGWTNQTLLVFTFGDSNAPTYQAPEPVESK